MLAQPGMQGLQGGAAAFAVAQKYARRDSIADMKRIGILADSAEGAALCFLEAVHAGERRLGAHCHPEIVMDIEAMGASMSDWERRDFAPIAGRFRRAAERLKAAGTDFWV